ncbi:hypothetical protein ACJX0J_032002, partial [Zea mays]
HPTSTVEIFTFKNELADDKYSKMELNIKINCVTIRKGYNLDAKKFFQGLKRHSAGKWG